MLLWQMNYRYVHVLIIAGASRVQSMYRFVDFFAMIPLTLCEVKMILMRKWDLPFLALPKCMYYVHYVSVYSGDQSWFVYLS